jgi:ABC-type Zn uptake system ZnuABC Zn-binding protein ZnuA
MPNRQRVFIILLLSTLAGCNRGSSAPKTAPARKIGVFATVYPLAEMARRVAGEGADVQWLCESGQRPEDVEGNPALKQQANRADLVITSGPWDAWALAEVSDEARNERVVEPGRTQAGRTADPKAYPWLDPIVVREMTEAARIRLTVVDASRDAEYRNNAAAYTAEVDSVHHELLDALQAFTGRRVLVVRPVWGAFCARYGLVQLAPVETRTEDRLTADDFKEIARTAKADQVRTIFVDASTPAGVRQRIEERTGLTCVTLDTLGTSAPDGRSTWARILRYDLEQLKAGLAAKPGVKGAR